MTSDMIWFAIKASCIALICGWVLKYVVSEFLDGYSQGSGR